MLKNRVKIMKKKWIKLEYLEYIIGLLALGIVIGKFFVHYIFRDCLYFRYFSLKINKIN